MWEGFDDRHADDGWDWFRSKFEESDPDSLNDHRKPIGESPLDKPISSDHTAIPMCRIVFNIPDIQTGMIVRVADIRPMQATLKMVEELDALGLAGDILVTDNITGQIYFAGRSLNR